MNGQVGRKKKLRIRYRLSIVFFGTVLIFGVMFYRYMKTVTLEDVLSEDRTITVFAHSKPSSDKGDKAEGETAPQEGENTVEFRIDEDLPSKMYIDCFTLDLI